MINQDLTSTSTAPFNSLPIQAQTLFSIFVSASLAANGFCHIPQGEALYAVASCTYEQLGLTPAALSDPDAVSDLLDKYFRTSALGN